MIRVDIPGFGELRLSDLVLDYNGTLACSGEILPGVREALTRLAEKVRIHVLTADTFGGARDGLEGVPCRLSILKEESQDLTKSDYVKKIGASTCACVGNGRNDRLMLREAALGIAVIQHEGAAAEALLAAQVVCPDILSALALLEEPARLVATLRA